MKSRRHDAARADQDRQAPASPSAVAAICRKAGFGLTDRQASDLAGFLILLMRWNRVMNLVGARDWRQALTDLVLDSFWLARFLTEEIWPSVLAGQDGEPEKDEQSGEIWDLGAGAGLPGIPLRLVWPCGHYTMVEAREKRALFLATALARLGPPRTEVFRGRAENFLSGRRADVILGRAFLPWADMLALTRNHLRPRGRVILLTREPVSAPPGWRNAGIMNYAVGRTMRYFCAFAGMPISAPS